MAFNHTILGLLSYQSMTGYDIKKIIQDSPFMYWSANNNQIYKALVELLNGGLVTNETLHQDGAPSKKIYTITDAGLEELKKWTLQMPEAPEVKRNFFIQLAWTEQLGQGELSALLSEYEEEVKGRFFLEQEKFRRGQFIPRRSEREEVLWKSMYEHIIDFYAGELRWIEALRQKFLV